MIKVDPNFESESLEEWVDLDPGKQLAVAATQSVRAHSYA